MTNRPVRTFIVFAVLAVTNGGLSEELGWRGYALPILERRWSAVIASVFVGVLWGLRHTGTGFWQMMLTADFPVALRFAATYLLQYLILVVPLAVLYTWLYHGTGGSLPLSMLLHASYNMTVTVVATAWPGFPLSWLVGLLWMLAIILVLSTGVGLGRVRVRMRV
jgi:uncharacterized protein